MENLTDLELVWAKKFRTLCASIAGVELFDDMWVEETPPIGTVTLPWNAVSIEYPFIDEDDNQFEDLEFITLGIRAFSFEDINQGKVILENTFETCCTKPAHKDEIYVPEGMISEESLMKAVKYGFTALKEFNLTFTYPFIVQLMIDDGGVVSLIEINEFD